jgi:hypothetical protein
MTDRIVPSPNPEEEPVEPTRAPESEEEPREAEPLDDDAEDEPAALP